MGHHLLKLLLLLIPEAVLLLAITLITGVILLVIVVLVEGVEVLPLGVVSDEVGGVTALKAVPQCSFSPAGQSHHWGCSRTPHQKMQPKRTRQTPKQMSQ
jgi:hypothetical protein